MNDISDVALNAHPHLPHLSERTAEVALQLVPIEVHNSERLVGVLVAAGFWDIQTLRLGKRRCHAVDGCSVLGCVLKHFAVMHDCEADPDRHVAARAPVYAW